MSGPSSSPNSQDTQSNMRINLNTEKATYAFAAILILLTFFI